MATIEDYTSGKAAKAVKMAYEAMQKLDRPLPQTELVSTFEEHVNELEPLVVGPTMAFEYLRTAEKCAIGDRLCNCEFPQAPPTCSVFLDELADAMVRAGKASHVSVDKAIESLSIHRGKPIVVSKVEGKYMEVCRTWPEYCFYWNMERNSMKCLRRSS